MITRQSLNPKNVTLTDLTISNFEKHYFKMAAFEKAWIDKGGAPLVVTSGVRSLEDQKRIYAEINAKRIAEQKKPFSVPTASRHLHGDATDFLDSDRKLASFCVSESKPGGLLEKLGLYMEEPSMTVGWVHLQSHPPASGNRIFQPYVTTGRR